MKVIAERQKLLFQEKKLIQFFNALGSQEHVYMAKCINRKLHVYGAMLCSNLFC